MTAELRRLRLARGETQLEVAKEREWSLSKFTRIENGSSPIARSDLEALLRHYGVTDADQIAMLTLRARIARARGWWEDYDFGENKALRSYVGYEDGASLIRMSQGLVIPGLLQVPEYTRVMMKAFRVRPQDVEQAIRLRQERQRRVSERKPQQIYLLDEAIVARPAGDAMPAQLRHLIEVASDPVVTIQVIPAERGLHFGLSGPFILLGFDAELDDVLYLENPRGGDLLVANANEQAGNDDAPVTDPADTVAQYAQGFVELQELALSPEDSLQRIEAIARSLS